MERKAKCRSYMPIVYCSDTLDTTLAIALLCFKMHDRELKQPPEEAGKDY